MSSTNSPDGFANNATNGVNPPSSSSSNNNKTNPQPDSSLNPRSCVTCRRRKVRCNKREPCSNCVKAGIDCIFPGPGRAPRKARRPPDVELLSRLRRLEGVVESLGGTDAIEKLVSANQTSDSQAATRPSQTPPITRDDIPKPSRAEKVESPKVVSKTADEVGRLVIDDSRSLYVSNRIWTSIGDQVEELQDILDSASEDEDDTTSPGDSIQSASRSNDGFVFGYSSLAHSLRNYHPTPSQVFILWKTYEQNVKPLITVVHTPTVRHVIVNAATGLDMLDRNSEALAFSIYLAAVISMTPEQCLAELGDDRDSTISRFRFATEQAMARANLLTSQNINLLQAAVIFVSSILKQDQSRFVWTLSAVILRLATGLGLHRDGTNFGLTPFETEMRRRLWWHVCIIDLRAAEDHGTDPMINDAMYDTKMPLNINDDDISPDSKTFPPERAEFTDMTFTLIRCQVSTVYRRLNYMQSGLGSDSPSLEERRKIVEEWHNMLNEKYIRHCDMQIPFQWSCATIARLLVAKLWLIVHHPFINLSSLAPDDRNRILLTSIEVIEFTHLLVTSESTARWSWLFGSYIQWHPIAFVLAELCVRPHCPGVDRAWFAVESVWHDWQQKSATRKASLWRPLTKLYKKAKAFRETQNAARQKPCTLTSRSITMPLDPPAANTKPQTSTVKGQGPSLMNANQTQFSSPLSTSTPINAAASGNTPSTKQSINSPADFNLDLNKNMNEIINDFMPTYSMMPNTTMMPNSSGIYNSNNHNNNPFNTAFAASGFEEKGIPDPLSWPDMGGSHTFSMPGEWDHFDDVMRDFQQDFEQVTGQHIDEYNLDFL